MLVNFGVAFRLNAFSAKNIRNQTSVRNRLSGEIVYKRFI